MVRKPSWFLDSNVLVSAAPTCGINKDGDELYVVDLSTGERTNQLDDSLYEDVQAAVAGETTPTLRYIPLATIRNNGIAVPTYYDKRPLQRFRRKVGQWDGFAKLSVGELIDLGVLSVQFGHGSPSADVRFGSIPYIKVSDLRAGLVNINPTNLVSDVVAKRYWGGPDSGLRAFDLLTPTRTSKNIGDMSILMPGQERLVLTKEIMRLRPGRNAEFDAFYLMWAFTLQVVRDQWDPIILMQTNREDVGSRYKDIEIPVPPSSKRAAEVSEPFRSYYEGIAELRKEFVSALVEEGEHYVYLAADAAAESEAPKIDE